MDGWPEKLKLISVLATTNIFLLRSTEEGFQGENPKQTALAIECLISHILDSQKHAPPQFWRILFAPTGDVQEIAMQNGWHETYMKLATEFDSLVHLVKDKAAS